MWPLLAFVSLGPSEMLVILIVGLLVFGRRLPEVGRQLGKSFLEFRRGLNSFRDELDADKDIQETRKSLRELQREVSRPVEIEPWDRKNRRLHEEHGHDSGASPERPPEQTPEAIAEDLDAHLGTAVPEPGFPDADPGAPLDEGHRAEAIDPGPEAPDPESPGAGTADQRP